MSLNAKQFAEKCGRKDTSIVKTWFDSGYLGNATRDDKTGIYKIPENTPIPYSADKRTNKNSTLWCQLLDAADKNQMVFSSMYPLLTKEQFEIVLKEMIENDLIEKIDIGGGICYLRLKANGKSFMEQTNSKHERKLKLEKVERIISNGANVMTIANALISIGIIITKFK